MQGTSARSAARAISGAAPRGAQFTQRGRGRAAPAARSTTGTISPWNSMSVPSERSPATATSCAIGSARGRRAPPAPRCRARRSRRRPPTRTPRARHARRPRQRSSTRSPISRQPIGATSDPPRRGPPCDGRRRARASTASRTAAAAVGRVERVLEQHRRRQDRRERVRLVLAGDVGRRAVHRLVEPDAALAEARRRQHAERARDHRGLVGEDVAEQVLGDDHVEARRLAQQQHRHRVDELVLAARRRGSPCATSSTTCTQSCDTSSTFALWTCVTLAAAPARRLERDARDARDLDLVVHHRVARLAAPGHDRLPARLAEVEAAGELAHDQQVDARRPPRAAASRRSTSAGNTCAGRRFANRPSSLRMPQQAALGARVDGHRVPLRPADGAEQHRARRRARARARASVSGVPCASIAAPPISRLLEARARCPAARAAASSTRRASRVTSGPMPSPGRTRMLLPLRSPSARRHRVAPLVPLELVQRVHVGARARDDDVGVRRRCRSRAGRPRDTVTDTSPSASMPPVIAFTWKRSSSLLVSVSSRDRLEHRVDRPDARARWPCAGSPSIESSTVAVGFAKVPESTRHLRHREALVGAQRPRPATIASRSSL